MIFFSEASCTAKYQQVILGLWRNISCRAGCQRRRSTRAADLDPDCRLISGRGNAPPSHTPAHTFTTPRGCVCVVFVLSLSLSLYPSFRPTFRFVRWLWCGVGFLFCWFLVIWFIIRPIQPIPVSFFSLLLFPFFSVPSSLIWFWFFLLSFQNHDFDNSACLILVHLSGSACFVRWSKKKKKTKSHELEISKCIIFV